MIKSYIFLDAKIAFSYLSGFDGLLQHVTHIETRQGPGIRICMVRSCLTSSIPWPNFSPNSRTKRLANVCSASSWFIQILVALPTQRGTSKTRTPLVPGNIAGSFGTSTWFPGIFVWLPLQFLWCHTTKLHPNEESNFVCVSKEYEITRSVHTKP